MVDVRAYPTSIGFSSTLILEPVEHSARKGQGNPCGTPASSAAPVEAIGTGGGRLIWTKPDEVLSGSVAYSGRQSETQTACEGGMSHR